MDKIRFYPIDTTYKIINNKPVIYLFGKTSEDKQICVLYEDFLPYFYLIPETGQDLKSRLESFEVKNEGETIKIFKVENVKKRYYGEDVNALKIFTKLPSHVPILREEIKTIEGIKSINENDILFVRRFMIDHNIIPMSFYDVEGELINSNLKVPSFKASSIVLSETDKVPKPKILAIDIETYTPSHKEIVPEKNPIIMLAFHGDGIKKVFVWKHFKTDLDYVEFVDSEATIIEKFKETIAQYKPDIITGYYSDGFDMPYIKARADKYKIKLDLGLDGSELRIKKAINVTAQITGIVHLDVFKFIRKIMAGTLTTDKYNLDSVAHEILNEKKHDVNLDDLSKIWDTDVEQLGEFCKYNLHDATLAYKLAEKLMPTIIEMVKITNLPIYDVNRVGYSQLVEWYLLKQSPAFNQIAPNKPHGKELIRRRSIRIKGAFVFEPKPGLYKDITVFDYRSLYPTIIGSHNISPGTLNCSCCEGTAKKVPLEFQNRWFCEKRKGFIPTLIEDLITRRMRIKEIIKDHEGEQHRILEARSNALKLLANSFYGYLGFYAARWYSLDCAESTTAYGRYYIKQVISKAEKEKFEVIYSDTDSVFLTLDGKKKEDALMFAEHINRELPGLMELEFDGFYPSGIFVSAKMGEGGAKKRYALASETGEIKIKGFESVRRNTSTISKETQEKVFEIILNEHDNKKAFEYVKGVINDLRNKKIPLDKVIISTQLKKPIEEYDAKGPHVAVAQRLKNRGENIGPGSSIQFVVTPGSDIIRNRARLPDEIKEGEYDQDYYINHQVVPAVERIFNVFGYKKEELIESKDQTKLEGFFK
ncbi:ribonuclease H-like domain-containing protein [Candidatus Woesearchaeota archaeon]|nr:ribonuclease H-like domain-containing protein [Candidatus Woesearchaeota archaeon]